jgi:predicted transcriptional regulator
MELMKSVTSILKNNSKLLDEPEVIELVDYIRELEGEIIQLNQNNTKVMENKLAELVRDIYLSINQTLKQQADHIRFGETEAVNFENAVTKLKSYIQTFARDNKFRL